MSILSKIENLALSRNIIRNKMIEAGQAASSDTLDVLASNLVVGSGGSDTPDLSKDISIQNMYNSYDVSGHSAASLFLSNTALSGESIYIGNNVTNTEFMFGSCRNFNGSVTIGNNVTDCGYMFHNCYNFNKPITIPDKVISCDSMFRDCYNFNSLVTIGNNVNKCSYMFENCFNFNQPITIPNNVINCARMFWNCTNMASNIYIKQKKRI